MVATTSSGPPAVSVVVPTYDRPARLAACLEALARQHEPPGGYEVVVVDDGSAAPVQPVVDQAGADLAVTLHRQANAGPAAARNTGADQAAGRFLAFTDDDCAPDPGWVASLARRLDEKPEAMVAGSTTNALSGNRYSAATQTMVTYLSEALADEDGPTFVASNNLAVSAEGFASVGGFDTRFPTAAAEDWDLCRRWRADGRPIVLAPDACIAHAHELGLRSFVRQHAGYGRGAYRMHTARSGTGERFQVRPLSFYLRLVTRPLAEERLARAMVEAGLLGLSQAANAGGFAAEAVGARRKRRGQPADFPG